MRFTLWTTHLYQESAWMQQSRTLYYQSASRTTLLFMMLKQYPFFFSFYGIVEYQRKNQSRCQLCQEGNREWSTVFEGRIQDALTEIQKDVATGNIDKIISSKHNIDRLEKYQEHLEDLQDRKESLLYILGD